MLADNKPSAPLDNEGVANDDEGGEPFYTPGRELQAAAESAEKALGTHRTSENDGGEWTAFTRKRSHKNLDPPEPCPLGARCRGPTDLEI